MLNVTEIASRKLAEIIAQQPEPVYGLRVSIEEGGCACHQYAMSLAREAGPGDWVGEFGGVKVLVDAESVAELQGVSIDYVESLQGEGFTISKPGARKSCGCSGAMHAEHADDHGHGHGGTT
jgi:iron-sulfur cluster assembly protein